MKTDALQSKRHRITGQVMVGTAQDLAEYDSFTQRFHDDYEPVGAMETQLVQSLADDAWRIRRAKELETCLVKLLPR